MLFSALFDWLISKLNETLSIPDVTTSTFIAMLDIFGFENFAVQFITLLFLMNSLTVLIIGK